MVGTRGNGWLTVFVFLQDHVRLVNRLDCCFAVFHSFNVTF